MASATTSQSAERKIAVDIKDCYAAIQVGDFFNIVTDQGQHIAQYGSRLVAAETLDRLREAYRRGYDDAKRGA